MKTRGWIILLLALALCTLCAPALAQTHTVPELGLTFQTPDDWLFFTGGRAQIQTTHQMQDTYALLGADATCWGAGIAYDGSNTEVVWNISSYDQPAWWIRSYQGLSDELIQEMNQENGEPALPIVRGKGAKFVLYEETTADAVMFSAATIEGGKGIYFFAAASPDAVAQVRVMMASFSFGAPMPAPAPAPAQRDAAAWQDAFAALWEATTTRTLPAEAEKTPLSAEYPLIPLRTYADESLRLTLLGDADGMLREVYLSQPLADVAQSDTLLADAFDAFGTTGALAMAITAEQTGALAIEANTNLLLNATDRVLFDENTPNELFYDWNGLDVEVGFDSEAMMLYLDMFL